MLPKLQQLRKQGRTIFFMATNHQKDFDPAIKRSGRFDLKIRMGPASYKEKLRALGSSDPKNPYWYKKDETRECERVKQLFEKYTGSSRIQKALTLFTFGEMNILFEHIRREHSSTDNVREGLENMGKPEFEDLITDWKKRRIALHDGSAALAEYEGPDLQAIEIQ
jgi:hypothetical protein